jgi:hypothetical protein
MMLYVEKKVGEEQEGEGNPPFLSPFSLLVRNKKAGEPVVQVGMLRVEG